MVQNNVYEVHFTSVDLMQDYQHSYKQTYEKLNQIDGHRMFKNRPSVSRTRFDTRIVPYPRTIKNISLLVMGPPLILNFFIISC